MSAFAILKGFCIAMQNKYYIFAIKRAELVKILETDLYAPVRDYLVSQGYTVHSEVKHCDITAVKGEELVVVELKTSFNLKLLVQAVKRQRAADSVYVAIPKPKGGKKSAGWRDMCLLLRRLELGLIIVDTNNAEPSPEIVFHPNTFDRLKSMQNGKKVRRNIIREAESRYGDFNKGGSTRQKLVTVYRENSIHIACCFMKFGKLSPAQLKKIGTGPKTSSILSKNYYGWFEKVDRGVYDLHEDAKGFLEAYPELVLHYMGKLNEIDIDKY